MAASTCNLLPFEPMAASQEISHENLRFRATFRGRIDGMAPLNAPNPQPSSPDPKLAELGMEADRAIKKAMLQIIRNINGVHELKDNAGWNQYAAGQRAERDATSRDAWQSTSAIDEVPGPAERIAHLVAKHAARGTAA